MAVGTGILKFIRAVGDAGERAYDSSKGLLDQFNVPSIGDAPLSGAPMPANIPQRGLINIGPNPDAEAAAIDYAQQSGIPYSPINQLNPVDAEFGALAAREYELMPHDPTNPFVADSYAQMKKELMGQCEAMLKQGIKPEFDTNVTAKYSIYPLNNYSSFDQARFFAFFLFKKSEIRPFFKILRSF